MLAILYLTFLFKKVVVAIGSAQESGTERNPWNAKVRRRMLESVFKEEIEGGKIEIVEIEDCNNDLIWARRLMELAGFDVVVTGNEWVARCFKGLKPVIRIREFNRERYCSSYIRKLMREGKDEWKELVPREIVKLLEER